MPEVKTEKEDVEMEEPGVHADDAEVTDDKMILEFRSAIEEADGGDKEEYLQV